MSDKDTSHVPAGSPSNTPFERERNSSGLTVRDYLETAADASRRTRFITIAMIVASVLVLISVLNSWDQGWISIRISALHRKEIYAIRQFPLLCMCRGSEVNQKDCAKLTDEDKESVRLAFDEIERLKKDDPTMLGPTMDSMCREEKLRLDMFTQALVRSAADTKYTVHVPFFGAAFDINDVGILGGVALLTVLILLRLSLRSQIVSLRVGFKKAFSENEESDFYDVLAARQVFLFPPLHHPEQRVVRMRGWIETFWQGLKLTTRTKDEWHANRNAALRFVPQFLSLLPGLIYFLQFYNDWYSRRYGFELVESRTYVLLILEGVFLFFICVFGLWCITKWNELDKLWDYYDEHIREKKRLVKSVESGRL